MQAQMQLLNYKRKAGIFAADGLFELARDISPTAWWELHGSATPELKHIALLALSQLAGVGAAERNWKCFAFIHDRRRNRLSKDKAEMLVRCHYNIRILNRLQDAEYEELVHQVYNPEEADDMEAQPLAQPPAQPLAAAQPRAPTPPPITSGPCLPGRSWPSPCR